MLTSIRLGFFLAYRQIRRSTIWTTLLIISIMMLTFLNLIVVNGVLIGLIEGSSAALRQQYSGDVLISNLPNRGYIRRSPEIIRLVETTPGVEALTTRYVTGGRAIANYQVLPKGDDLPNQINATIVGIDPVIENRVTRLSERLIAGEYLSPGDDTAVLVGSSLMNNYTRNQIPGESSLKNVDVGDKIRIIIGTSTKDVVIKGVVKSKIDEVSRRIYFVDKTFRQMIGRADGNVDEIAMVLTPGVTPESVTAMLKTTVAADEALVQTWEESQGSFFKDISTTFRVLGNLIGSIGIIVASITIFIVIFINAVTRKRYIGILKGIGVSGATIEWSYIFQSLFYAIVGSALGLMLLYGFLKPYIDRNPIDFPFSDGILVAEPADVFLRIVILLVMTILAGYVPSRIIVRKNTLDSILGR